MKFLLLLIVSFPLWAVTPSNSRGTAEVDEVYQDKDATELKLKNDREHLKRNPQNQQDIDAMKYDPYFDSDLKGKNKKINNKDPRD